jgi:hypothetical protein
MSSSLHLDDILNENSKQSAQSAQRSTEDTNSNDPNHQMKLFQMYVSACERNSPRSEESDSSDESIHHGRDCCASSGNPQDARLHTTLDSFLLQPGRRPSNRERADMVSSPHTASPLNGDQRHPDSQNPIRSPLSSEPFSGWPCQRSEPPAHSNFQVERNRPLSDSRNPIQSPQASESFSYWPCRRNEPPALSSVHFERSRSPPGSVDLPTELDHTDQDMYMTQVVFALTSGKTVWL